jgi:ribonuclease D
MAEPVRHQEHDVVDPASVEAAARAFAEAPALAVDLETDSMHVYQARLCFLQVATNDDIWVVDTLAPGVEAGAFAGTLLDPTRRKIFHDAQGDLRVLAGEGLSVRGLFDTHRAATFLGLPKVGLGDLVEQRFGVKLAKEHQTADFGRRPLPPEIRSYVANDVRYLLPLAEQLEGEATERGILDELRLEFERISVECARPEAAPKPKLPPAARNPLGLAVADAVDAIRHRLARERNVPVGRVLPNAAVGEVALRLPKRREDLVRIPGVKGSVVREAGEQILETIARLGEAAARGQLPPPEPKKGGRPDPGRRDREARLKAFRAEVARARGVTPSVVLPTHLVEELSTEPPADLDALARVRWLGPKRLAEYGPAILAALRGDPAPRLP